MRHETKHLLKNLLRGLLAFALFGGILFGVYHVSRLPVLTIQSVAVSGGKTIDHTMVRDAVEQELAGEYLRFIPKRFVWMYPEETISARLHEIDRIYDIAVVPDGQELNITFEEYVPSWLWCETVESEQCMFVNDTGYSYAPAPQLKGGSLLRLVTPDRSPVAGAQAFVATDVVAIRQFQTSLDTMGWYVKAVELTQNHDAFVHLVEGGELKVALTMPAEQIVSNLETVLSTEAFTHIEPGNFVYIDLRFGNKVFVNEFGNPNIVASSTASSTASTTAMTDSE